MFFENKEATFVDENGDVKDYNAAVSVMDDDLREELHAKIAPCTPQEFIEAYTGGAW